MNRMPRNDERELAEVLKQEARKTRPAFSEALHSRICRAIRCDDAVVSHYGDTPRWPRRVAVVALAASLLLLASRTARRLAAPPSPAPELAKTVEVPTTVDPEVTVEPDAIADITGRTVQDLGHLVGATLARQQWAYLDHDAQVAAQLLREQLPLEEVLE